MDATYYIGMTLEDLEKQAILKAYRFFGNVKTTTAASLAISVRTLDAKLEKYAEEQKLVDAKAKELEDRSNSVAHRNKEILERNISKDIFDSKVPPAYAAEENKADKQTRKNR